MLLENGRVGWSGAEMRPQYFERAEANDVFQVIGRSDKTTAAPEGTLPVAFGRGSDYESLIQLWAEKGFSPRELAALIGAHSVSQAFSEQENGIPSGGKLHGSQWKQALS